MDSPDQHVTGMGIDKIEFRDAKLHFEMAQIGGVYDGALDPAKSEITGHWKQGGQDMDLNLKRVP